MTTQYDGHTKGPWHTAQDPESPLITVDAGTGLDCGRWCIATVHAEHLPPGSSADRRLERNANARLIAAAPDLLRERDELLTRRNELIVSLGVREQTIDELREVLEGIARARCEDQVVSDRCICHSCIARQVLARTEPRT